MSKHREACEALADHFYNKSDERGIVLLDEILEYEFMSLRILNDAYAAMLKGKV